MGQSVLIRRWRRWLKMIEVDVVIMFHQRHIFREIMDMFPDNPILKEHGGTVSLWLAEIYTTTAAVGVRRQADRSKKRPVVSLDRLLSEMIANPGALRRTWFVRPYVRGKPPIALTGFQRMGVRDFEKFAGRTSKYASTKQIRSDRRRLRRAAARVEHYVNKRIAHRASRGYRGPATFGDLNGAIDMFGSLLRRYALLLNQKGMISAEPTIQTDWEAIFRVPWRDGAVRPEDHPVGDPLPSSRGTGP